MKGAPRSVLLALLLAIALVPLGAQEPVPRVLLWQIDDATSGLLVEDHRVPVVFLRLDFPAGSYGRWARENHAAEAFEAQIHDPRRELLGRADQLAIDLELSMGARASTFRLSCRREDLEGALGLVRDVLANRDFDRADLDRRGHEASIGWSASQKEPEFVLEQAGARILFHDADPRRRSYEKPESISTDLKKLAQARDVLVRLPGRAIGFAGDLTLEDARRLAVGLLPAAGEAPAGVAPQIGPVTDAAERPRERTLTLPRLTQVYFAYGRDSLGFLDPDHAASLIADEVLGGHFNSRLMVALRQEGGETYGASSRDDGDVDPGPYALTTFTRAENASRTEEKLRAVLRKLHDEGIGEKERADAAGYLVGRRAFARQSPDQVLATALTERRQGLPAGFFDDAARKAAELPLAEVNAFIAKFYDPGRFTMLKVAPR